MDLQARAIAVAALLVVSMLLAFGSVPDKAATQPATAGPIPQGPTVDAQGKPVAEAKAGARTTYTGKIAKLGYSTTSNPGTYTVTWESGIRLEATEGVGLRRDQFELMKLGFEKDCVVTYWFDQATGANGVDLSRR